MDDQVQSIVEEVANWAADREDLHYKVQPLAKHYAEVMDVTEAMFNQILVAMGKAIETGIYLGKFGFPDERVPDVFKDAFNNE